MAVCAEGHQVPAGARFCGVCGEPVPLYIPPAVDRSDPADPVARASDVAIALAGRTIGTYAIVGVALGVSTLVFLWAIGFFDVGSSDVDESFGTVLAGGIAVLLVLVFGLLMGLVLALFTAAHVASGARSRREAFAVSFASAAIGYVVLAALLGAFVVGGIALFQGTDTRSESSEAALSVSDVGYVGLGGLPGLIIASAAGPLLYDRRTLRP
jgi:hypothetical protein